MAASISKHTIIYDSESFRVLKEVSHNLVVVIFEGIPTSEAYQEGINLLLEHSKKDNICKWILDCKKGCAISNDDQYWTSKVITHKIANELNLQRIAVIEPNDSQDRVNLITLAEMINKFTPIDIQFFEKEYNARSWLSTGCDFNI